jgi:hypothetical protein
VYILPIGFHLKDLHERGQLTKLNAAFHASIVAFGLANLLAQFF